jgi:uncharacterized lipoprotein YddW (UPF0748 family)
MLAAAASLAGAAPAAQAQLFNGASPFAPAPASGAGAAPNTDSGTSASPAASAASAQPGGPTPEFRGLWVDAYRDGYKTPAQVDQLLADARRANVNALLVQMRARGDALYSKSLEPRIEDPAIPADFDPLAYLIQKAHNEEPRIEVQAWIVVTNVWGSQTKLPADPRHVYNLHGPNATGADDWLSRREDGVTWSRGYFVDPGNPDAAKYTTDVALSIVREYDVDGLHLDYIRYPERADGLSWGYNQTSIDRFNAQNNRTGRPDGSDPLWSQWRRDQISALVRGIYQGAFALKPQVKISAAVIPWGDGPRTDADWQKTSAYTSVFQDWRSWLEEGILDQAMPMTYFRESVANQPAWFDHWVAWARDHAYGRQVIPAVALYLNDPAESISQVRRALAATGPNGNRVAGVGLYSYGATRAGGGDSGVTTRAQSAVVWAALTDASSSSNGGQPPFASRVALPGLVWKSGTLSQTVP